MSSLCDSLSAAVSLGPPGCQLLGDWFFLWLLFSTGLAKLLTPDVSGCFPVLKASAGAVSHSAPQLIAFSTRNSCAASQWGLLKSPETQSPALGFKMDLKDPTDLALKVKVNNLSIKHSGVIFLYI